MSEVSSKVAEMLLWRINSGFKDKPLFVSGRISLSISIAASCCRFPPSAVYRRANGEDGGN